MKKLERSVTKPFWEELKEILKGQIDAGCTESVLGTKALKVLCNRDRVAYVLTEIVNSEVQPKAWLYLCQKPKWEAWEVLQVFVPQDLRRTGLSTKLYKAAILDGLILASGKTQSASSRGLWKSFIKRKVFDVYAIDFKNLEDTSEVFFDTEDNELWCALDIYSNNEHRDVRFVATRKTK